jgi:hypothetical protein
MNKIVQKRKKNVVIVYKWLISSISAKKFQKHVDSVMLVFHLMNLASMNICVEIKLKDVIYVEI